jgi:succinate-semialdehyde dehydrogenase / glutarate-semialdehyde dehydrogenase
MTAISDPETSKVAPLLQALSRRVEAADPGRHREITNAMTGQPLGRVPQCTRDDVVAAAHRARAVQRRWAQRPLRERTQVMLRFHDLVLRRQDEVLDIIQLENGKARTHAFEEVADVCLTARYYANTAEKYLTPKRRQGVLLMLTEVWEHRPPKGLVGIISPWNYPLTLGISDALPAIVAGNAVLAKPDNQTPFSALWAVRLLEEAGMPQGLVQIVTGSGSELGTPIIEQSDYLMFTGSTDTGRQVAAQAGERLIDCSMELGGKNALLVLDDAHVGKAATGAVRAAFSNAGQLCISVERIYVPTALWDAFVDRFVAAAKAMRLSAALDYSADMGSLINEKQLETVTQHVDDAVQHGATVLAGGRPRPDIGPYFYEPTILTGVREGMTAFADETFGPVVSLYPVQTEQEAIEKANDSPFGLNFSVWTSDLKRGRRLATQLQAGTVNVNEGYAAAWASVDAPMGGMKASGLGRRHGELGILKYTEPQTIAIERGLPVGAPPWMRAGLYARVMSGGLRVLRRLPGVK